MNIGSNGRPYVHSNADNLMSNGSITLVESMVAQKDIEHSITILQGISEQLKKEAEKFLMGCGAETVMPDILRLPDTYAGLAADIIQNKNIITSLLVSTSEGYVSKEQISKVLDKQEGEIEQIVLQKINSLDEIIPIEKFAVIIGAAMGNKEGKIIVKDTGATIENFFKFDKSAEDAAAQAVAEGSFKRLQSSKAKNELVKRIKQILLSSDITHKYDKSKMEHSVDKFMRAFKDIFLSRVSEINFWPIDYSPRMYLKDFEETLRQILTKDIIEFRNAAGAINEEIIVAAYLADKTTTLTLTAVGSKTEEDIVKQFPNLTTMNTHHGGSKQSQSDIIIQNKKGMTVRAQSKTSTGEFTLKIENKETARIINHLQRSVNIYILLKSLNESGLFPINNIDNICYAIANALWFNTHESITGQRETGHFDYKKVSDPNILPDVIKALNAILAQQIPSFMGISVDRAVNETKADMSGSNIFYIENGNLVPTYLEMNEVIRDLEVYIGKIQNTAQTLTFTIENAGKTSWIYDDVEDFWLAKYEHGVYRDEPGYNQGEAAISSTRIHGTFRALLNFTSYFIPTN